MNEELKVREITEKEFRELLEKVLTNYLEKNTYGKQNND